MQQLPIHKRRNNTKRKRMDMSQCYHHHDRDINAAHNIRDEGKRVYDEIMNRGAPGVACATMNQ